MARPKKIKLLLLAVVLLLLLGGGAAGAYFLWWKPAHSGAAHAKTADTTPPVFLKLDTFTVNMTDSDADRYLQADITLKMTDQEQEETLKNDMPELRNNLLLLLSSKDSEELKSVDGKQALAKQIQAIGNRLLVHLGHHPGVDGVEFNTFIIQ